MFLVSRNYKSLLQIKRDLDKKSNCRVHVAAIDVSDLKSLQEYIDSISNIDVVINNAGYSVTGKVIDVPIEAFKQNVLVNFFAPVMICVNFLNKERRNTKKIINILSTTAIAGR